MNIPHRMRLTRACFCALGLLTAAARADYIDYTVILTRHWHSEYGSSGGNCWETGSEEYSGISKFQLNNDGTWLGGTCYTIDNNGDATKTINETIASKTLQSSGSVLDAYFEAWEDDSGSRSTYDSGDDCHTAGTVVDDLTIANTSYRDTTHEYGGYGSDDHTMYFSIWWNWSLPTAPTAALASSIGQTGFTANWNGPSGYRVTNYKLYVATDSSFTSMLSGYNGLDVGTSTSQTLTGLSSGTTYYYRLTAANERGTGDLSGTASVTTLPAAPGILSATGLSTSGFTARWSASTGATAYYLDVATDSSFGSLVSGFSNLSCGSATSQAVSGLSSGTTYYYRVRAANGSGTGANSSTQSALTFPAAPAVLAPADVLTDSFTAHWSETTGATSYLLDVATDSDFASFVSGYSAKNVGTATSESVAGLTTAGTYYYRVCAVNASGTGAASAARQVVLFCETPDGLTASDAAVVDRINVLWNSSTGAEGYKLYRSTLNDISSATNVYDGTTTLFSDTNALAHTTYYYWVCATNPAGNSAFSDSDSGSRKNATPSALALSNSSVNENAGENAAVGTLSATDTDDTSFTFSLVSGTGSTDNSLFNISGSTLRATASLDYETQTTCSIRVRVTDPHSATYEKVFSIAVLDVSEGPVIAEGGTVSAAMAEDGVWTAPTITATGGTGALTWSLSSAADQGTASASGTGASPSVSYMPPTDWSGTASFVVRVTDESGLWADVTVQVSVSAVNDAPTMSCVSAQTVAFNAVAGPLAVTVNDVDTDAAALTLEGGSDNETLLASANIVFGGSGTNRTVTLTPATNRAGTATVTLTVSDGELTAQRQFTLTVEKGGQTVSFGATGDKTYGDDPFAVEASASSGLAVQLDVLSGPAALEGSTLTLTGAGTVSLQAAQDGDDNYLAATNVLTLTVAPKELVCRALDAARFRGTANPTFKLAISGFVNGESVDDIDVLPSAACTADADSPCGTYPITCEGGSDDAYEFRFEEGTLTVQSRATVLLVK